MSLHVLGAQMTLSGKQHLNVLRGGIEDRWEVIGCHLDRLDTRRMARYQGMVV